MARAAVPQPVFVVLEAEFVPSALDREVWSAFFSSPFPDGDDGIRTHDPLLAGQVLSQLSYTPMTTFRRVRTSLSQCVISH